MILIILYILYLIINFTYKEYKINSHIEYISQLNKSIKEKIVEAEDIIKYKSSLAYRNKILKEQQSFKNKWENVVYLTTEKIYNTYTKEEEKPKEENIEVIQEESITDDLSIYEKWMHLIFKKDIY